MKVDVQGHALSVLSKVAQADWPDRLNLRKSFEKLIYSGSRASFRMVAQRASGKPRIARPQRDDLFDLTLSDDQQMLVDMLQGFALGVLRPAAHEADGEGRVPAALLNQARELGLVHYGVSEAQGGLAGERTVLSNALIAESLAQGDFSLAATLLGPLSAANCIRRWGSSQQQAEWLPAFVCDEGAPLHALAVTEAAVLADPQVPATLARRRGKHYLLDGEKALVLGGMSASRLLVTAQASDGAALFLVDAASKGITRQADLAMGLRACGLARIQFKSVRVPVGQRLAAADFDFCAFLDYSALAFCALAVGTAQAALDYVVPYCNERQAFGEPISHRQGVAFMIAEMAIELESMRLMLWRACALAESGRPFHREAYLARLLCTEKAMKIGCDAVQLLGGHGFTQEHPVERWYRDLRSLAVLAGGLHL